MFSMHTACAYMCFAFAVALTFLTTSFSGTSTVSQIHSKVWFLSPPEVLFRTLPFFLRSTAASCCMVACQPVYHISIVCAYKFQDVCSVYQTVATHAAQQLRTCIRCWQQGQECLNQHSLLFELGLTQFCEAHWLSKAVITVGQQCLL